MCINWVFWNYCGLFYNNNNNNKKGDFQSYRDFVQRGTMVRRMNFDSYATPLSSLTLSSPFRTYIVRRNVQRFANTGILIIFVHRCIVFYSNENRTNNGGVKRDLSNHFPRDCTCHSTSVTQSVYSILICLFGSKRPLLVSCDLLHTHDMVFETNVTT